MTSIIVQPLINSNRNSFLEKKAWYILCGLLVIAVILKLLFFMGFSLGDDPAYARGSYLFMGMKSYNLLDANHVRFSVHLTNALFFKLLGVSDFSFVLSTLIYSLVIILLVYLLASELFNRVTGLLAAAVLVFSPFDMLFSSTMTIDFHAACGALAVLYFFIRTPGSKRWFLWAGGSALLVPFLYYVKIPSLFIYVVAALVSLLYLKQWPRILLFFTMAAGSLAIVLVIEKIAFGSFTAHYEAAMMPFKGMKPDYNLLTFFPRWMFGVDRNGHFLFGLIFYAALPCLVLFAITRDRRSLPVVIWLAAWFIFMNFFSVTLVPYTPAPRFFRYTYMLVPAAAIIIGGGLHYLLSSRLALAGAVVATGMLIAMPLVQTSMQRSLYRDSMKDMRAAMEFFETVYDKAPVYSDNQFVDYFHYHFKFKSRQAASFYMGGRPVWEFDFTERLPMLYNIQRGYVVTGGSRYWHINKENYLYRLSHEPPADWLLLKSIDESTPGHPWKSEPLRIYYKQKESSGPVR
jgi:hypothetical protein